MASTGAGPRGTPISPDNEFSDYQFVDHPWNLSGPITAGAVVSRWLPATTNQEKQQQQEMEKQLQEKQEHKEEKQEHQQEQQEHVALLKDQLTKAEGLVADLNAELAQKAALYDTLVKNHELLRIEIAELADGGEEAGGGGSKTARISDDVVAGRWSELRFAIRTLVRDQMNWLPGALPRLGITGLAKELDVNPVRLQGEMALLGTYTAEAIIWAWLVRFMASGMLAGICESPASHFLRLICSLEGVVPKHELRNLRICGFTLISEHVQLDRAESIKAAGELLAEFMRRNAVGRHNEGSLSRIRDILQQAAEFRILTWRSRAEFGTLAGRAIESKDSSDAAVREQTSLEYRCSRIKGDRRTLPMKVVAPGLVKRGNSDGQFADEELVLVKAQVII